MSPSNTKANATNGILPIAPPHNSTDTQRQTAAKPPAPRLKVIVRRLPPGLSQAEFIDILGPEWKLGQGKVDWFVFVPGKISKDPSKLSRPSRAYLNLTSSEHLIHLSDVVKQSIFEDAQNTFGNKCLIGPPTVEYALYRSKPSPILQSDARAGTIDQDPEFMAFLERIANPTKGAHTETSANLGLKHEKVTTTPLVQYLREKKATKTKEIAAKTTKKQEINSIKGKNATKDLTFMPEESRRVKESKTDRMVSKPGKEAVKILNRDTPPKAISTSPKPAAASPSSSEKNSPKLDTSKEATGRQAQRGTAMVAHIRMLQRDLGLSSDQAFRQTRRQTTDTQKVEKASIDEKVNPIPKNLPAQISPSQPVPTAPRKNNSFPNARRGRGKIYPSDSDFKGFPSTTRPSTPVVLLKKPEPLNPIEPSAPAPLDPTPSAPSSSAVITPTMPKQASSAWKPPQIPPPTEGATQAFVKHANPSQGVTEPLLKEAMEKFGAVSKVEIDRKKGFAYVDFIETEGLRKAMAANPIPVAQGTVQVMQRKGVASPLQKKIGHHTSHAPPRNGRGNRSRPSGRRGGRSV
ncbi:hypothetical protein K3495_g8551 [Podosphaera aphanis]|nr:hypothetical protein K3495_g8551 [Podosphaera aphanis]